MTAPCPLLRNWHANCEDRQKTGNLADETAA